MKLYADQRAQALRQLLFDVVVLVWVVVWARIGYDVYHRTTAAEAGARNLSAGGVRLRTEAMLPARSMGFR